MSDLEKTPNPDLIALVKATTPARLLVGRAGESYRTQTLLQLRADHAAATDAVHADLGLSPEFIEEYGLFTVTTLASDRRQYLLRPDLGRTLGEPAKQVLRERCPVGATVQIVIGDGLSATAITTQVPILFPKLITAVTDRGWTVGQTLIIRQCRVGVMNTIGELLDPTVVVLLIGERPGLATAESLSAYLAYRPRIGHTDAQRNLISNIHARGVPIDAAVERIVSLIEQMLHQQISGPAIKEILPRSIPLTSEIG